MGSDKNQEINDLSLYINNLTDQDVKILLLKLKNEMMKDDVTWDQIKGILNSIKNKNSKVLSDIIPLIV